MAKKKPRAEDVLPNAEDEHGTTTAVAEPPKLASGIIEHHRQYHEAADGAKHERDEMLEILGKPFMTSLIVEVEEMLQSSLRDLRSCEKGDIDAVRAKADQCEWLLKRLSPASADERLNAALTKLHDFESEHSLFVQGVAEAKAGVQHADVVPTSGETQ